MPPVRSNDMGKLATLPISVTGDEAGVGDDHHDVEELIGGRRSPLRRCIVTGTIADKSELFRFVIGPDGHLVFDAAGRLPGRGLWVMADYDTIQQAVRRKHFSRAAKRSVVVPVDLPLRMAMTLRRQALSLIGMARRAGECLAGYEQVRDALRAGRVALRLEAADGAEDGRAKLAALAPGVRTDFSFTSSELAEAVGRDHVVHLAVMAGGLATRLSRDFVRLAVLCRHPPASVVEAEPIGGQRPNEAESRPQWD